MTRHLFPVIFALILIAPTPAVDAHCQIPCGIYDDEARFTHMGEILTTIEKSMQQIGELSAKAGENTNQLVRWVQNKEDHAEELAGILRSYFLQQRIKFPAEGDEKARARYLSMLETIHRMLVHTMKAKQTTDVAHVASLRTLLDELHKTYGGK